MSSPSDVIALPEVGTKEWLATREVAAIKIQSWFRGILACRQVNDLLAFKREPQWKDILRKFSANGRLITAQVQITDNRIVNLKLETNVDGETARKGVKISFKQEVGVNETHLLVEQIQKVLESLEENKNWDFASFQTIFTMYKFTFG
jgi:hypothetical protein